MCQRRVARPCDGGDPKTVRRVTALHHPPLQGSCRSAFAHFPLTQHHTGLSCMRTSGRLCVPPPFLALPFNHLRDYARTFAIVGVSESYLPVFSSRFCPRFRVFAISQLRHVTRRRFRNRVHPGTRVSSRFPPRRRFYAARSD